MDSIRKIIQEELAKIFLNEDFRYRYDGSFNPTEEMVNTCKKALEVVESNSLLSDITSSNEGSGKSKANSIINKEPMTHSQLKRMKAYFDNHFEEVKNERIKGNTLNNSGILQSWDLWGGDAAKTWVEKCLNQRHSSNNTSKTVRGASGIRTKNIMDPHNTRIHK
jgi:hypothetical protein